VLSVVANRLTGEARGAICCRLDGDIVVHTPRWASVVERTFREGPPDLGVVGPKQLGIEGRVHAAGSWILHPRGHHHVGQGADPALLRRAAEVDHVMGCFYCHRRAVWEQLGGYDESILRGQTVDFGLRSRLAGWRTWFVPTIEFTHRHAERVARATRADSRDGIDAALDRFSCKWGFDRLAPDLDEVARRYAGTPLLWNARVFGPAPAWPPPATGPVDVTASEWGRFAEDERYREAVNARLEVARDAIRLAGAGGTVLVLGARCGLLSHLLALDGHEVVGIDPDPERIRLGRAVTARQQYPLRPPRLRRDRLADPLPVDDATVRVAVAMDVLEHHPNPVGVLRAAHRALAPDGVIAIVTRRRELLLDDDPVAGYRPAELVLQVQSTKLFRPEGETPVAEVPGALALLARRQEHPAPLEAVAAG
jgi:SAM-dependent methyltransferase